MRRRWPWRKYTERQRWSNHVHTNLCVMITYSSFSFRSGLAHWGRHRMAAVFQTTFSNTFLSNEFRRSLFLSVEFITFQIWVRLWIGTDKVSSHYQNRWCLKFCVTTLYEGIHRWPLVSRHKGPVTRNFIHLMTSSYLCGLVTLYGDIDPNPY